MGEKLTQVLSISYRFEMYEINRKKDFTPPFIDPPFTSFNGFQCAYPIPSFPGFFFLQIGVPDRKTKDSLESEHS